MKRWILVLAVVLLTLILAAFIAASEFNLSALPEPGRAETYLATKTKRFLIDRASRAGIPREPLATQASVNEGDTLYGVDCSTCHGMSGRTSTETGRWMYPRAADLGSRTVQHYSNRELFWIIKNGIRLSGMPAFGKVETDDHIWDIVQYVRTLKNAKKTG